MVCFSLLIPGLDVLCCLLSVLYYTYTVPMCMPALPLPLPHLSAPPSHHTHTDIDKHTHAGSNAYTLIWERHTFASGRPKISFRWGCGRAGLEIIKNQKNRSDKKRFFKGKNTEVFFSEKFKERKP